MQKKDTMANPIGWILGIGMVAIGAASMWWLSGTGGNQAGSTVRSPNDEQGTEASTNAESSRWRPSEPKGTAASAATSSAIERASKDELMGERRKTADKLRRQLAALGFGRNAAHTAPASAAPPTRMPSPAGSGNQSRNALGEYIRTVVREQFHPVAGSCYEQLLERDPGAEGDVVLGLSIVGNDAVGGVVEAVEVQGGTTLTEEEFLTCVSESMYTTTFDAPPDGQTSLTVTYPFSFAP